MCAGDCVLDIGAGTGALSVQAAALGPSVTAIDLSGAMVARLRQRLAPYPECKALVMDGEALTFEDSTFEAVFSVLSATLFSNWSAGAVARWGHNQSAYHFDHSVLNAGGHP